MLMTLTFLFSGCGEDTIKNDTPSKIKTTSVHKIILKASSREVHPGEEVIIGVDNNTTLDNQATYRWTNSAGQRLGTDSTLRWTAPAQEGNYSISLVLNFGQTNQSKGKITISVKANEPILTPLETIQDMIKRSGNGSLQNVTYICIGDSTRVYTTTPEGKHNLSRHIFEDINASLSNYNVTSYLVAEGGLMFKTFNGDPHYTLEERNRPWINVQEAIDHIPGDGSTTFVDVSMGSNDYSALFHLGYTPTQIYQEMKKQMLRMIDTIKKAKPKTKFLLTATNPYKDWDIASKSYLNLYKEVSKTLNIPFLNFVEDIMPPRDSTKFKAWYLDGIHFNDTIGLPAVSQYILDKILPTS